MRAEASGIIVAAGSGVRMGGLRKPLIKLGDKTVFERVLSAFDSSCVSEIIVVGDESELSPLAFGVQKPLRFVSGGKTRAESVFAGVSAAANKLCCVHDCARPFVTAEVIDAVINAAIEKGAATACTKVTDTVKYVNRAQKNIYTPDRDFLFAIQTPQAFMRLAYMAAYAQANAKKERFTDESGLLEAAGFYVEYVEGRSDNIKLTTAEDVRLAKAMLFLKEHG